MKKTVVIITLDCAESQPLYNCAVTATLSEEVRRLSVSEKVQLAEALWDEVAVRGDEFPVPEEHKRKLDERLAAANFNHRLSGR